MVAGSHSLEGSWERFGGRGICGTGQPGNRQHILLNCRPRPPPWPQQVEERGCLVGIWMFVDLGQVEEGGWMQTHGYTPSKMVDLVLFHFLPFVSHPLLTFPFPPNLRLPYLESVAANFNMLGDPSSVMALTTLPTHLKV